MSNKQTKQLIMVASAGGVGPIVFELQAHEIQTYVNSGMLIVLLWLIQRNYGATVQLQKDILVLRVDLEKRTSRPEHEEVIKRLEVLEQRQAVVMSRLETRS